MLLICIVDSFCSYNSSSLIKYVPIVGYFHVTCCTMFTKWLKVGMSDMQEWTEKVLESNRLYSFVFLYICSKLWQGHKAVLTIIEFEYFDIFFSKFQLVSTFSICNKFCVENWLFCCDLSCKWVTYRSGCKRFWKSALHLYLYIVEGFRNRTTIFLVIRTLPWDHVMHSVFSHRPIPLTERK